MLYEDDVKRAVVRHLKKHKFVILKVAKLREHGPDIIATTPSQKNKLWVEAKGQTSSDTTTGRYGKQFNSSQRSDHLGKAILHCMQWTASNCRVLGGIALPADEGDIKLIKSIEPGLRKLKVTVFWVHEKGVVDTPFGLPK